ncbi:MAG: bacillithiol biosynthesis deacetylase BshB1 [Candidatus Latescibacteria bacterium]|nr:bacillithiol biosynthesis deacetylase BshB1 [Candidatus Latescibacterota bacterium]
MTLDLLVFAPHRDDAELHCGGLLIKMAQKGYAVGVVDLTLGEMATRGTVEGRAREAAQAAAILGLAARDNLEIPDTRVDSTEENQLKVIRAIRTYRPRLVLLPYETARHPDHRQTSLLIQEAAFLSGLPKIDTGQDAHRPQRLVFYFTLYNYRGITPSFIVDITAQYERKMEAVRTYGSQFYNPASTEPETFISRPEFLVLIDTYSRYFGSLIGVERGEPFFVREYLELDDPVAQFGDQGKARAYLP